jgi:hypothetical protein
MALKLFMSHSASGLEQVDLFPDETIVFNRMVVEESILESTNFSFTKDFTIPASDRNNKLLRHFEMRSNLAMINPNNAITARLDIDGIIEIVGAVEVMNVTWKLGKPNSYSIVFYSDTSTVKTTMGETLLEDVDFTEFDFTWADDSVVNSWAGGTTFIPVISWERFYRWYASPTGHADDIAVSATGVLLNELRVGFNFVDFIEAIGTHFGLTFNFSSELVTYFDEAFIIPSKVASASSLSEFKTDVETTGAFGVTSSRQTITMTTENSDPRGRWTSPTYTPEFNGTYKFEVTVISAGQTAESRTVYLVKDAGAVDVDFQTRLGDSSTFFLEGTLSTADTYHFEIIGTSASDDCSIRMVTTQIPADLIGNDFDSSLQIPEIKAFDFLNNFLSTYKLILVKTSDNIYSIKSVKTFYSAAQILDLNPYVDNSSLTYRKIFLNKAINFQHDNFKDAGNTIFDDNTGSEYGWYIERPSVDFAGNPKTIKSIFTVFPPEYLKTYDGSDVENGLTDLRHQYQLSNEAEPKPTLAKFMIMYRNGSEPTSFDWYLQTGVDGSGDPTFTSQSTMGAYSQIQDFTSLTTSNTFAFNDEAPFIGAVAENSIYKFFYKDWFDETYKVTAYTIEIKFPVNLGVFKTIQFIPIIFFNGFYHRILDYKYDTNRKNITLNLMRYDQ